MIKALVCVAVCLGIAAPALADSSRFRTTSTDIGRLFMSPEERARIDAQRARGVTEDVTLEAEAPRAVNNQVVVNGWVSRSSGADTVWVNGEAIAADSGRSGDVVVLRGPGRDRSVVIGRSNGKRAVVKPGQAWDLVSNTVEECAACSAQDTLQVKPEIEPELDADSALAGP